MTRLMHGVIGVVLAIPNFVHAFNLRGRYHAYHAPKRRKMEVDRETFCPTGRDDRKRYMIKADARFAETSYIAYSQQTYRGHKVIWIGSDGEQNTISAADLQTGEKIRTYELDVKKTGDWESISLGPCSSQGDKVCVYCGNTGNNPAHTCGGDRKCSDGRSEVEIYKFEEPNVSDSARKLPVTTLAFKYDTDYFPTKRADSETLFVDHSGDSKGGKPGDIYLVTKWPRSKDRDQTRLAKIPVEEHEGLDSKKYDVKLLSVAKPTVEKTFTGGDMRQDGRLVALRSLDKVYFFTRLPDETVADALERKPCSFESETKTGGDEKQFEAVTMIGSDVAEASECKGKKKCKVAINVYELKYKSEWEATFHPGLQKEEQEIDVAGQGETSKNNVTEAKDQMQMDHQPVLNPTETKPDKANMDEAKVNVTHAITKGGDAVTNTTASKLVYQAEDYTKKKHADFETKEKDFTGSGYMDYEDDGYLEWSANAFMGAGDYRLSVRYAVDDKDGRECRLFVNDMDDRVATFRFRDTGGYGRWKYENATVALREGYNRVRIEARDKGPHVDKMELSLVHPPDKYGESEVAAKQGRGAP